MRRLLLVLLALLPVLTAPLPAQEPVLPPRIDKDHDPNDWESYYDIGVAQLPNSASKADAAFYWASRHDPTRAEPIFGRWVAFWMLDISEWEDYVNGSPRVLAERTVVAADTLRYRAWERNPFVNEALRALLTRKAGYGYSADAYTQGWVNYVNQRYQAAITSYTAAVGDGTKERFLIHFDIARVYTQMSRYDSAAAQVELLLAAMRNADRGKLVYFYDSKAMFEYALGLLYAAQGKLAEARDAQGRALEEDLAFAPAHAELGRLALLRNDDKTAADEYGLAVELAPTDGALRYWYGKALLRGKRTDDGAEQLRAAVRLEPYFAEPYLSLGAAYESQHDSTKAVGSYEEFVRRAPRHAAENIGYARSRITELGGKPPS
jgi:hypothetical protein